MSSKWVKKQDQVVVISGNDKGKTGTVLARKEHRVVVQGINIRKKHMKRTKESQSAQIIEREMPIHISNIAFADASGKKIKVKMKKNKKGEKELFYLKDGKETLFRQVKKLKK